MDALDLPNLTGWLPGRVAWDPVDPERSVVQWVHCDQPRFTDAFFDQTLQRCLQRPFNVLFRRRTGLAELERWAEASPGLAPAGFIFHVSRCGSTLLTHLLGKLEDALVLSEPEPVDTVIRRRMVGEALPDARKVEVLRAMVSALGQPRAVGQRRLFIKFDAWDVLQLPLIRQAFPDTPWIFLYREPVEVLVSAVQERGVHLMPEIVHPSVFGIDPDLAYADPDDYAARVLASIYAAGLRFHEPGRSLLVDYTELPAAAWGRIADHFGGIAPNEIEVLRAGSSHNPKRGGGFTGDSRQKQNDASSALRTASAAHLDPIYAALEAVRKAGA